jgi:hypothetical protein
MAQGLAESAPIASLGRKLQLDSRIEGRMVDRTSARLADFLPGLFS